MRKKCFFCALRYKKNSIKCQFCDYHAKSSKVMREGLAYLESGFEKINNELDDLEQKVHLVIGIIFKRHKYSAESLQDSAQMDRIKSYAGKIKDDVTRWDAAGKLEYRLRLLYNENAEAVQNRVHSINQLIQERKPMLWERVGRFFKRLYRAVFELLPSMFRKLISGSKRKFVQAA